MSAECEKTGNHVDEMIYGEMGHINEEVDYGVLRCKLCGRTTRTYDPWFWADKQQKEYEAQKHQKEYEAQLDDGTG